MIIFIDDEKEYLSWLARHPEGFVVNSYKKPLHSYLMLHRATCKMINLKKGNHTTHAYIKTCSQDKKKLEIWAKIEIKGDLSICKHCNPQYGKQKVKKW